MEEKKEANNSPEQKETNKSPEKKTESPKNINLKEENIKSINKINLTVQVTNNMKTKTFTSTKLTKEFTEEDEEKEINIKYKEHGSKIIAMSLDLLLKKITSENFVQENPIIIYAFCQQCFCFIDKDILFNKIFNCYEFYKRKKVNISQIINLIQFLDILVIEMYEYYNSIPKSSNPILITLDNFYQLLLVEIVELMNKKEEEEEERKQNLNKEVINKDLENIFSDKIDSNENLISDKNEEMIKERFCIYIPDNIDNNENDILQRDRYDTMLPKNYEKYMNIKTEPNINLNKKNNVLTLSKDNLPKQMINKPKIKLNKDKKNEKRCSKWFYKYFC